MRIAIVEDMAQDREQLREYVCRWAAERMLPLLPPPVLYTSGEALLEDFHPDLYDVIFLDIYMDGITGMETARRIREQDGDCRLAFITASADFAVESYDVTAAGYLVKPITYEGLCRVLDRCGADAIEQGQFITVRGKSGEERIYLHRIAYTEFESNRICVHYADGERSYISMRQRDFAALLAGYPYFCDCMRGIIVNLEMVDKLLENKLRLKTGETVPVSRLKYSMVREQFLKYSYSRWRGGH